MKRVVALVMVVVLMVMGTAALADSQKDSEKYLEELKYMSMLYKLAKDKMEDEPIMYTYLTLVMAINAQSIEYYNLAYALKKDGLMETAMNMTASSALLTELISNAYYKYTKGEMTKSEILEILMPMADSLLEDAE